MDIEKEINDIKERNKKVELNKAWKTNWIRKIFFMLLTYIVVILFSLSISKITNVFLVH